MDDSHEATIVFYYKPKIMVLVEDPEPFIASLIADTEEVWLGHDGLELMGALSTLGVPRETWRLTCVFCSNHHVDLESDFDREIHEPKRANGMISKSLEFLQRLAER